MTEFSLARYSTDDWRLIKWDGSTETDIGDGWTGKPTLEMCITALFDYHAVGNSPFSSRESTVDSLVISNSWPIPTRDMTLADETLPWDDS